MSSDDKFRNTLDLWDSDSNMATTFDEERILQQIQHLNDSQRIFDFLFNNNSTPNVSTNNKYFTGTDFQCENSVHF